MVLTAMGCGMQNMCRRRNEIDDDDSSLGYSVAVSNSLLKEESFASKNQPPCMNCVLIEMGEMVCYSERCPDCGRSLSLSLSLISVRDNYSPFLQDSAR